MQATYVWQSNQRREQGYIHLDWIESWSNYTNFEEVDICFSYRNKIGQPNNLKLFVHILFATEKAESSVRIKRYKEHHPKEDWAKDISKIQYEKIWPSP
jgi:hypothetical protein